MTPFRVALLFAVSSTVAACSTTQAVTDSGCKSFKPITNSKLDTLQTRREVIAHNRVFTKICKT